MRLISRILWVVLLLGAGEIHSADASPARRPYRDPVLAGARSLAVPGWGQHHMGEADRGWGYFGVAAVALVFAFEIIRLADTDNGRSFQRAIGWGGYASLAVFSATDAYASANRRNRENGYDLDALAEGAHGIRLPLWSRRF